MAHTLQSFAAVLVTRFVSFVSNRGVQRLSQSALFSRLTPFLKIKIGLPIFRLSHAARYIPIISRAVC